MDTRGGDKQEPTSSTCQGEEDKQGEQEMEQDSEEMEQERDLHHQPPAATEVISHANQASDISQ